MTTMKITIEDFGITKTYEKDFGEEYISVDGFFETCLEAYSSNEYMNGIEVNIFGLSGNVTQSITWDKHNYINVHEEMDVIDDLLSFVEQGKGWTPENLFKDGNTGFWFDGVNSYYSDDLGNMTTAPTENWYMGHKY